MNQPGERAAFERRVYLLRERMRSGQIALPPDEHLKESLLAIRTLPNGRLDFLSVDELARCLANTMSEAPDEESDADGTGGVDELPPR